MEEEKNIVEENVVTTVEEVTPIKIEEPPVVEPPKEEKKSKKKLIIIISIVAVFLIGLIVALILLLGGKKKYTVTYDTDGGNKIESREVEEGATVPRPANPTKEGYIFKEWTYGGTPYYFNVGITGNMTLKASWEEDTSHKEGDILKVTFVYDNGDSDKVVEIEYDKVLKRPDDPVYEGYEFNGWFKDDEEYYFYDTVKEDFTLTAKWEKQKDDEYIINFNSDGGSYVELQTVKKGNKIVEPKDPTKQGYKFVEWQLNGVKYDFTKEVTSNLTLKAKWESNITITFDSKGGSSVPSQKVEYGGTVTKPANPTKDGYTFVDWLLKDKVYNFEDKVTESLTLEAKWQVKENSISCTKSDTVDGKAVTLGVKATIDNDKVTKVSTTYTFTNEQDAQTYYSGANGNNDSNVEISGTVVTIKDLDEFSKSENPQKLAGMAKTDFVNSFTASGYTCK